MVAKCLSSMHHFVPTRPLPAPLLLPTPFPKSSAAVQFPIWRHFASPCATAESGAGSGEQAPPDVSPNGVDQAEGSRHGG